MISTDRITDRRRSELNDNTYIRALDYSGSRKTVFHNCFYNALMQRKYEYNSAVSEIIIKISR